MQWCETTLQLSQVIRIICVIWVTFCPGQNEFHQNMLISQPRSKLFSYYSMCIEKCNERLILSNRAVTNISRMQSWIPNLRVRVRVKKQQSPPSAKQRKRLSTNK